MMRMTDILKRRKKAHVAELKPGQAIDDLFVVRGRSRMEPYADNKKHMFELKVGDSTGEVTLKYWGGFDREKVAHLYELAKKNSIVHISGRVGEWGNQPEIRVNPEDTFHVCSEEEYEPGDFLPVSKRDREEMLEQLRGLIGSVEDPHLHTVLNAVFTEEFTEAFAKSPAALYKHHNWIGGLLEHTLGVARLCNSLAELYPYLDRNLLIAGALLHDIGKTRGFQMKTALSRTSEGVLVGHPALALGLLDAALAPVDAPEQLKLKLRHILMSSLGRYGGLQRPAFPEALAISYAKAIDTRLSMMHGLRDEASTEEEFLYSKDFGDILLEP